MKLHVRSSIQVIIVVYPAYFHFKIKIQRSRLIDKTRGTNIVGFSQYTVPIICKQYYN